MAFENSTNLFLVTEFFMMLGLVDDISVTASTLDSLTEKAPIRSAKQIRGALSLSGVLMKPPSAGQLDLRKPYS
jgi:hypothetical protein